MLYMALRNTVVRPVLITLLRPRVTGLENVPDSGPVLLVSNHLSALDTLLLPVTLPRQIRFVAKQEYFKGLLGWFLTNIGTLPVDRSGGRGPVRTLQVAADILKQGHVFGIYPEGTRSPDGRLYQGHTGVARLALQTDAVVVPVVMVGTQHVLAPRARRPRLFTKVPGRRLPKRIRTAVVFGEPIDLSQFTGRRDGRTMRAVTDQIMERLAQMSGQEYVHEYAQRGSSGSASISKH